MKLYTQIITVIAIGIIVYTFGILYPRVTKLTQENSGLSARVTNNLLEEKHKCADAGKNRAEKDTITQGELQLSPLYVYNESMKTCIYYTGKIGGGATSQYIYDLYTNKPLAVWIADNTTNVDTVGSKDKFEAARKLYLLE